MTSHTDPTGVAAEVRGAMAKQKKTAGELAQVIGVTPHTAGRRLNGAVPFKVIELMAIATWLGVDLHSLLPSPAAATVAS